LPDRLDDPLPSIIHGGQQNGELYLRAVKQRDTYRNILQYALAIAGSEPALAVRLRAPIVRLRLWLDGGVPIPDTAFLDAVDLVVSATRTEIARSREAFIRFPGSDAPHGPSLD
jgi:hypothetical protein